MKKTSFKKQIELNPKAHELSVALNMVGLNANPTSAELILRAQAAMRQMKGKFDLQTAIKIKKDVDDAYSTIESDFK